MQAVLSDRDNELATRTPMIVVVALVVAIAGGLALRWFLAFGRLGSPDSDEAIVGLMAHRLLTHHDLTAFYWHQYYGGSLEAMLVAPFVAVFGTTNLGLKFASIAMELAGVWLTWRIARHLFREWIAAAVGVIALVWPVAVIWFGTKERGFYPTTVALGLTAVLAAINIDEEPARRSSWLVFGGAVGVGWWMSPNIAAYAVPMGVWLLVRHGRRHVQSVLGAAGVAVAGASVWIVATLRHNFATLHAPHLAGHSTYATRFGFYFSRGLPFALGLRRPWRGSWYLGSLWGPALYLAAVVAIVLALRHVDIRRAPDLYLLAASPFFFAAVPGNWTLNEGRYTYFLASILPLALGRVLALRWGAVLVGLLVVASGLAFAHDYNRLARPIAPSIVPITHLVEANGYRTVVTDYWNAFRITYLTGEHVIATPLPGDRGVKFMPYVTRVQASTPAYIFRFIDRSGYAQRVESGLRLSGIPYRVVKANGYFAVLPSAPYFRT